MIIHGRLQINVPKSILEDLRETFDHFDPNKTGAISIRHFHTIIRIFAKRSTTQINVENEIEDIIESKQATWNDVLNLVSKIYRQGAFNDEAQDLFRVFDKKDKGVVCTKDIKEALENELKVPLSEQDISDLMLMLGADAGDKISFDDFRYYFNNIH